MNAGPGQAGRCTDSLLVGAPGVLWAAQAGDHAATKLGEACQPFGQGVRGRMRQKDGCRLAAHIQRRGDCSDAVMDKPHGAFEDGSHVVCAVKAVDAADALHPVTRFVEDENIDPERTTTAAA